MWTLRINPALLQNIALFFLATILVISTIMEVNGKFVSQVIHQPKKQLQQELYIMHFILDAQTNLLEGRNDLEKFLQTFQ